MNINFYLKIRLRLLFLFHGLFSFLLFSQLPLNVFNFTTKFNPLNSFDNKYTQQYLPKVLNETHFSCDEGTKIFPISKLNDNICDCEDNSDENLTNACPYGKFKCQNKMYFQRIISTSKLGDNYCDCCDGSDEPKDFCIKNCYSLGKAELSRIEKEYDTFKKIILSYSEEDNKKYFSYHINMLKRILNLYEEKQKMTENKLLLVKYIQTVENSITDENVKDDYVDKNQIKLNDLYQSLYKINGLLKNINKEINEKDHIADNYIKYGMFKEIVFDCQELTVGNLICNLCDRRLNCWEDNKDNLKITTNFGEIKEYIPKENTFYFEGISPCGNYGLTYAANILFECGEKEEMFLSKIENECLYKFIYYTKIGCNNYKFQSLFKRIDDIINH